MPRDKRDSIRIIILSKFYSMEERRSEQKIEVNIV